MNDHSIEAQLRAAEERANQLSRQLDDLKKELEDMTYAVSHDLRAPLRAVHGFADALREDFGPRLEPEAQRYLSIIGSSARQMTRMIDGILTLSRIGRQAMQFTVVPTRALLQGIIDELKSKFPERKLEFHLKQVPDAYGDHALLRLVWTHLLVNAVKFTATREVSVITIDSSEEPEATVFSVSDNGVGFDMKYEPKLFGLFQRFHTEAEFEGSGVGLAVVRRLVTRHNGKIWAKSELNVGTTFFFSLPHPQKT